MKIPVWTLVMNLFEIGKKYKIIHFDEDNGQVYINARQGKRRGNLLIDVMRKMGKKITEQRGIKWR